MNLNKDEISKLWDSITPKLYGYLLNVLKDKRVAEDILQTTWLKAMENLGSFGGRGDNFSAWLFAIARNEMRMHWRKGNQGGREIAYDPSLHDHGENDQSGENKILVDQILDKLSEEEQDLIRLRYIAELTPDDIGKLLKLNSVNVRVKIHRALARARVLIKDQIHQ